MGARQQWADLAAQLRAQGNRQVEIAGALRERFGLGALAAQRHARGWSQGQAAGEWTKRWPNNPKTYKDISDWETGRHTPRLETWDRLAQLYGCDLIDLLADRPGYREPAEHTPAPQARGSFLPEIVDGLSAAMLCPEPDLAAVQAPDLDGLARKVQHAWELRQRANYAALGALLSSQLSRIEHDVDDLKGDEHDHGLRLVVHTYNAASSLFKKLDDTQLGLTAADRAVRVARSLDDPVLVAAAAYRLANVLLVARRSAETQRVALDAASTIEPDKVQTPRSIAMWGGLLLTAAVAAGRSADETAAWELLGEARTASRLLKSDHADLYSIFGPTNVAMHAVQVAVELGNGRAAVERARPVDPNQLPASLLERRSQFLIDLAHGHVLERNDDDAVVSLLQAEHTAPEEVRFSRSAHTLIRTMLHRERKGSVPGLRDLAGRLDVAC